MASKPRTITVRIDRTKHKKQPFIVTKCGRVEQELDERYASIRNACVGAVRACRDFLQGGPTGVIDNAVKILLPDGRHRYGYLWRDGSVHLDSIITTARPKRG